MYKLIIAAVLAACLTACAGSSTVVSPRVKYNPDGTIEVGVEIGVTRLRVAKNADGSTEMIVETFDPTATNSIALAGVPIGTSTTCFCRTVD